MKILPLLLIAILSSLSRAQGQEHSSTIVHRYQEKVPFSVLHLYGISQCELAVQSNKYLLHTHSYFQLSDLSLLSGYQGEQYLFFNNVSIPTLLSFLIPQNDCTENCYCSDILCIDLTDKYVIFTTPNSLNDIRRQLNSSQLKDFNRLLINLKMSINPLIGDLNSPYNDMRSTYTLIDILSDKAKLEIVRRRIYVRVKHFFSGDYDGSPRYDRCDYFTGYSSNTYSNGRSKTLQYCSDNEID